MPSGRKGSGVASSVRTEKHTIYAWSRWWVSQEALDKYRENSNRRRRKAHLQEANHGAEVTPEMIARHNASIAEIAEKKRLEKRIKFLKDKVIARHGMSYNSNRHHFRLKYEATGDPEVRELLTLMSTVTLSDSQKLDRIRALFTQNRTPADILYNTAVICGINIRKQP